MDYRSKTNLERARQARAKRTKKAVLIALVAALALVLVIAVVIIAREAAGNAHTTTPESSSLAVPTESNTPGESSTPPENTTAPDGDTTTAPTETTGGEVSSETGSETEPIVPGYKDITVRQEELHSLGYLLLVNNGSQYIFPASTLRLVSIYDNRSHAAKDDPEPCSFRMMNTLPKINSFVMTKMNDLFDACYAATKDNNVYISGAYRSYEDQKDLADRYPTTATKPGYSEYHTGMAFSIKYFTNYATAENVDMDHAEAAAIREWMLSNCYKYGFIRRYPPDKDSKTGIATDRYHFRYVGAPHAYYMYKNNLCMEEYLALVSTYEYTDNHLMFSDDDGNNYEIYYVQVSTEATTTIPVPTDCHYTVEGNNYSGFVVTCYRSMAPQNGD